MPLLFVMKSNKDNIFPVNDSMIFFFYSSYNSGTIYNQ